jgi:osmotically-inducible protein OsmY
MDSNLAPASTDIDLDLTERVSGAINALDVLRGTRAHVAVTVTNGHVTLDGVVQSPMAAVEVERAAAAAPGAAGLTSRLTDDASLSRRVAEALATDPRTAAIPPGYRVVSVFGTMWLVGYFTPEQSQALAAVCRGVPGVRTVTIKAL